MLARIALAATLLVALPAVAAPADDAPARLTETQRYARAKSLFDDALAHYNLGDYDAAAEGFARAYLYEPMPMLLYNLGQVAVKQGRREKAIELYRRYQAVAPRDAAARVRPKIEALEHALAHEPPSERAAARLKSGRALLARGRLTDAAEELNGGYALDPDPAFLAALGELYEKQGDKTRAIENDRRFLESAPAGDPLRPVVKSALARLEPPAPPKLPAPAPPPVAAPVVARKVPERSRARRLWWIAPACAVVVAGIALGLYFGLTADSTPTYPVAFPAK